jgi:hypothetical protein
MLIRCVVLSGRCNRRGLGDVFCRRHLFSSSQSSQIGELLHERTIVATLSGGTE